MSWTLGQYQPGLTRPPRFELIAAGRALKGQLATIAPDGRAAVARRVNDDVVAVFDGKASPGNRCQLELTYPGRVTEMRAGGSIAPADWVRPNRYGCVVTTDRRRRTPVGAAAFPWGFGRALKEAKRGELVPVLRVQPMELRPPGREVL